MELREIGEGASVELVAELACENIGIGIADAEGDEAADVAEDSLADGERELINVLMAEGEAKAVFAGLG